MVYEYVFIGAGTANLAAANYLIDSGCDNILLLEKGKPLADRLCPGESRQTCFFCNRGCDITQGVGGTAAPYGNKLCYFPASDEILSHFSDEVLGLGFEYLDKRLRPYFSSQLNNNDAENILKSEPFRKSYISDFLNHDEFRELINLLTSRLNNSSRLKTQSEVISIRNSSDGGFYVQTESTVYEAENVVLGTGRSSHKFIRRVFDRLRVNYTHNSQDIGIRLESQINNFTDEYYYQFDPKFKIDHRGLGTSRTFCGERGGIIVPVQYGDAYYVEGAFPAELTDLNSVALMARTKAPVPQETLHDWCLEINEENQGLLLKELNLDHDDWVDELIGLVVDTDWPDRNIRIMLVSLIEALMKDNERIIERHNKAGNKLKVYAPAIDRYWPRPSLVNNLECSISNMYVLGDAIGVSRGFVQALTSGACWAVAEVKKREDSDERSEVLISGPG